ncbi:MAG: uroporphyrinogen-III synthase, partial [Mailhella sp.]|nr:uroporphyrinogen-III synthase [Mailhella sp.]
LLKAHPEVKLAAIGPVTAQTLCEFGFEPDIQPEKFSIPALADALCAAFAK